ncbi:hypothetical protein R3P38DRAFT_3610441 [Favolaschia claudopus]|uniref:DUF4246 domain-containing protein n=1 Tax=Favolaschia claudopus TaxID=2862362 RepID=A0AAW0A6A2_9AGAR
MHDFLLVVAALRLDNLTSSSYLLAIALVPSTSSEVGVDVVSPLLLYHGLPPRHCRLHRVYTRISTSPRSPRRYPRRRPSVYLHFQSLKALIQVLDVPRARGLLPKLHSDAFKLLSGPPDASNSFKLWISRARKQQDAFKNQNSIFRLPPSKALTFNAYKTRDSFYQSVGVPASDATRLVLLTPPSRPTTTSDVQHAQNFEIRFNTTTSAIVFYALPRPTRRAKGRRRYLLQPSRRAQDVFNSIFRVPPSNATRSNLFYSNNAAFNAFNFRFTAISINRRVYSSTAFPMCAAIPPIYYLHSFTTPEPSSTSNQFIHAKYYDSLSSIRVLIVRSSAMLNEHIVVSGIYYYEEENISESRLAFRVTTGPPVYHKQDDELCMDILYGLKRDKHCYQDIGSIATTAGRALAWPNIYQHRVAPFRLLDAKKPGHRKILAIFLQKDWIVDALMDGQTDPQSLLSRLPPEVLNLIVENLDTVMTRAVAEQYRLELMQERTGFIKNQADEYSEYIETFSPTTCEREQQAVVPQKAEGRQKCILRTCRRTARQ